MGRDIPHFRYYLKKALDVEPGKDELDTPPTTFTIESGMVVSRAQQLKQDELEEREHLQQKQDGPIVSALYPVTDRSWVEESEEETTPPTEDRDGDAESDETVEYLDGVITHSEPYFYNKRERASKESEPYFYNKRERASKESKPYFYNKRERE